MQRRYKRFCTDVPSVQDSLKGAVHSAPKTNPIKHNFTGFVFDYPQGKLEQ